jgi:3-oxoacyl-ACP reductase-like protein
MPRRDIQQQHDDDMGLAETEVVEYDGAPADDSPEPQEPEESEATYTDPQTSSDLPFPTPPVTTMPPPHPDINATTSAIEAAVRPLEVAIAEMAANQKENVQESDNTFEILSTMSESLHELLTDIKKEIGAYESTVSSMKFQTAMMQSFIGQHIPAAVKEEIDRLYAVEDAYNIAELAERVIEYITKNPALIKLPEDEDETQMLLAMINTWHVRAHPGEGKLRIITKKTHPSPQAFL